MNSFPRLPVVSSGPMRVALIALLAAAALPLHAQVASFDCHKAQTPTEHAICASPDLARKDITAAAYYQLLLRLKPATAGMAYREFDDKVRDDQRQWLQRERDICQGDTRCLSNAYDRRIDALLKTFDTNAGLTFGRRID